jgi:hypothetical protein
LFVLVYVSPVALAPSVQRTFFFPPMNCFCTCFKDELALCVCMCV